METVTTVAPAVHWDCRILGELKPTNSRQKRLFKCDKYFKFQKKLFDINLQMIYIHKKTQLVLAINNKSMFCPTQQVLIAIDKVKQLCKNDRTGSSSDDIRES